MVNIMVVSNMISNYRCPEILTDKKRASATVPSSSQLHHACITVGCTMMEIMTGPSLARDAGPIQYHYGEH